MTATQAPCPGVKGHGINNVPGAWYDAGSHVDSALAVVSSAADYFGPLSVADSIRANHIASLMEGALELLKLAQRDIEELERQLTEG